MKARVIETGEIIEVKSLYSPVYSHLDCNGKIIAEYDEDELEFISDKNDFKMISLNKAKEWLEKHAYDYLYGDTYNDEKLVEDFYNSFK